MNSVPLNTSKLAAMRPDELRSMIRSVRRLTDQIKVLTDYFERAGDRLKEQSAQDLSKAVQQILHEQYGPEDGACAELMLANTMIRSIGAELFVKKLLWGSDEEDIKLAMLLVKLIPPFELAVQEHPVLLLRQATECLEAIKMLKFPGAAADSAGA